MRRSIYIKNMAVFFITLSFILSIVELKFMQVAKATTNSNLTIKVERLLQYGTKGEDVLQVQSRLYALGYLTVNPDGSYGRKTVSAVIMFQAANGLEFPDGKVGIWTEGKLNSSNVTPFYNLEVGSRGNAVKVMQGRLKELGYFTATNDGIFGEVTRRSLQEFQSKNGLEVTGIADQTTLSAIYHVEAIGKGGKITLTRVLSVGHRGTDVLKVQARLVNLGYLTAVPDSTYGKLTKASVIMFQADKGLSSTDGKVGVWTIEKLNSANSPVFRNLKEGDRSNSVLVMQKRLVDLGYLLAYPDGAYGILSNQAIRVFQKDNNIPETGIADQQTLSVLYHDDTRTARISINRTLGIGMRGDDVRAVQQRLKFLGYFNTTPDGVYGKLTKASVIMFQADYGLNNPDGMVGGWTIGKLNSSNAPVFRDLKEGDSGNSVLILQKRLAKLGYLGVEADGKFGKLTKASIEAFQFINGLESTGIANQVTLSRLYHNDARQGGYLIFDQRGNHVKNYANGQMLKGIEEAGKVSGVLKDGQGNIKWQNNKYYTYISETEQYQYDTYYEAAIEVNNLGKGLLIDKNGQVKIDISKKYGAILGKTEDPTGMMIRSKPSSVAGDYDVIYRVPYKETVEILEILKDFYEVSYFSKEDGKTYTGYMLKRNKLSGLIYVDIFTDDFNNTALGYISEKFESNGDAGTISSGVGDAGGVSYGAYQLSSTMGSLNSFVIWLKDKNIDFHNMLNKGFIDDNNQYGTNFNTAWKSIAENYYHQFYSLQKEYSMRSYYNVTVSKLKSTGVDYSSRLNSFAVQNMIFSISIQHGATGGYNLIKKFGNISDIEEFVNAIYDERSKVETYFHSSSEEVRQSVKNRFVNEREYILRIFGYESAY